MQMQVNRLFRRMYIGRSDAEQHFAPRRFKGKIWDVSIVVKEEITPQYLRNSNSQQIPVKDTFCSANIETPTLTGRWNGEKCAQYGWRP